MSILRVLGSGSSEGVPVPGCTCRACNLGVRRRRTGYVVESEDTSVWLDLGPDFREQLLEYGKLPDAIFISHKHFDHIAGLADLRQALILSGEGERYKPYIFIPRKLHVDLLHDSSSIETAIGAYQEIYRTSAARFVFLDEDQAVVFKDLAIRMFYLKHADLKTAALCLAAKDASILYLSDAEEISLNLLSFLNHIGGVDLVIIHLDHMNIEKALEIPAKAYLISHISHRVDKTPREFDAYLRERYGGNVFSAVDSLIVDVDHHIVHMGKTSYYIAHTYLIR